MIKKTVKVKIINMKYDKNDHLFMMKVKDIEKGEDITFAISADDFGIPQGFQEDVIIQFCEDMKGKEKNLHIEVEGSSIKDAERDETGSILPNEMRKLHDELDNYAVDKIVNKLNKEDLDGNNED